MSTISKRRRSERKGRWAEWRAALFLRLKGYKILERRYKTHCGEIDIIAKKGDLIAMIEVKARKDVLAAVYAVTFENQSRIKQASDVWLSKVGGGQQFSVRYDIVAIIPGKLPQHFPDAF